MLAVERVRWLCVPFRFVALCPGISAYQRSLSVLYRHFHLEMTRDSNSYGLLGHPLYGPLASADTTSVVLAWKPKPSTLRIAELFPSSHLYYTRFTNLF